MSSQGLEPWIRSHFGSSHFVLVYGRSNAAGCSMPRRWKPAAWASSCSDPSGSSAASMGLVPAPGIFHATELVAAVARSGASRQVVAASSAALWRLLQVPTTSSGPALVSGPAPPVHGGQLLESILSAASKAHGLIAAAEPSTPMHSLSIAIRTLPAACSLRRRLQQLNTSASALRHCTATSCHQLLLDLELHLSSSGSVSCSAPAVGSVIKGSRRVAGTASGVASLPVLAFPVAVPGAEGHLVVSDDASFGTDPLEPSFYDDMDSRSVGLELTPFVGGGGSPHGSSSSSNVSHSKTAGSLVHDNPSPVAFAIVTGALTETIGFSALVEPCVDASLPSASTVHRGFYTQELTSSGRTTWRFRVRGTCSTAPCGLDAEALTTTCRTPGAPGSEALASTVFGGSTAEVLPPTGWTPGAPGSEVFASAVPGGLYAEVPASTGRTPGAPGSEVLSSFKHRCVSVVEASTVPGGFYTQVFTTTGRTSWRSRGRGTRNTSSGGLTLRLSLQLAGVLVPNSGV